LIAPTKQILQAKNVKYKWHEFFPDGVNMLSLLLIFLLATHVSTYSSFFVDALPYLLLR
jgi:hypothetical protein